MKWNLSYCPVSFIWVTYGNNIKKIFHLKGMSAVSRRNNMSVTKTEQMRNHEGHEEHEGYELSDAYP